MGGWARGARRAAWLVAALAVAASGCGDDLAPVRDGLYLGASVTFEVQGRGVRAVRLAGLECRVAHPADPRLALCLERAPGLPGGALPIDAAGRFSGRLGEVTLTGRFDAAGASGAWRFETACGDGSACVGTGEWRAEWRPAPVVADPGGPPDAGAAVDGGAWDAPPPRDATAPGDAGPLPPDASDLQRRAHERLLGLRGALGVAPMAQTAPLDAAAQAHADYYARHASQYAAAGLSPHSEDPAWAEGFTGAGIGERLAAQGVGVGVGAAEVMAFVATADAAVDGWLETLYHRIPLVHPNAAAYGYGGVSTGALVQVMDVLYGAAPAALPARYPPPDAVAVPPAWAGNESPQPPLPAGASYPSGPVVTVSWPHERAITLSEATLTGPDGGAVAVQRRSPADDAYLRSTWALYPLAPLAGATRYTVRFEGVVDGAPTVETWAFTTR